MSPTSPVVGSLLDADLVANVRAPRLPTIDHAIGLPPGGTAPIDPPCCAYHGALGGHDPSCTDCVMETLPMSRACPQPSYLWRTGYDSREEHLADILRDIEGGR